MPKLRYRLWLRAPGSEVKGAEPIYFDVDEVLGRELRPGDRVPIVHPAVSGYGTKKSGLFTIADAPREWHSETHDPYPNLRIAGEQAFGARIVIHVCTLEATLSIGGLNLGWKPMEKPDVE